MERIVFSLDINDNWNALIDTNVVFLDSTKHGTNRYGMKLACFTTIDSTSKTQILAAALLKEETKDAYIWLMNVFDSFFSNPDVIFTDGDEQMINAIEEVFGEETIHLRCIWHIWKNFYQKFHSCFERDQWREVAKQFWTIAKTSDIRYCDSFEGEWHNMIEYMRQHASCDQKTVSRILM